MIRRALWTCALLLTGDVVLVLTAVMAFERLMRWYGNTEPPVAKRRLTSRKVTDKTVIK